jgi:hypothetical protein
MLRIRVTRSCVPCGKFVRQNRLLSGIALLRRLALLGGKGRGAQESEDYS